VSPTSTTTYTVVGTDAANCQGTDLITITVNPLPIVNGGVDQTVCAGTSITLSGSGASTYSWNNGAINGTSFVPSATTTYTITGTSASGCTATDQVLVTVNPLPTVNAGSDQLISLPISFVNLSELGILNLSNNLFTEFPKQICGLKNLVVFDISVNQLKKIDDCFTQLSKMKFLNLAENVLITLPTKLGSLSNLKILDVSQNQLKELPSSLEELTEIESLKAYSNQLTKSPTFPKAKVYVGIEIDEVFPVENVKK
jgi:Leucine-rich repeat (LRR) protein